MRIAIFKKFQRQYCGLTKRIKKEDLPNLNSQYDMFVFGGDQIWCVENSKVDDTYFGDFINDNRKKISYAPSFGITHLPGTYKEKIGDYLGKFKAISVREKSGQEIIKEILRIEPSIVLDPVFLIGKEYYDKLATKTKEKDNFCLCYIRDKSYGIAVDTAKELTERYHLKMMTLSGTDLNGSRFPIVGPESWLSLIKSAKIIVTNSFHAVCFSIIYHKEFYVDANQNATRIINILKMLGLEDRILPINKIYDAKSIDWNKVDKIIECECQKSKQYLKEAIFS